MNTKRQTVWLVSMLGLMVVLSAYYLFTDEVKQTPASESAGKEIQVDGTQSPDGSATAESHDGDHAAPDSGGIDIGDIAQLDGDASAVTDETATKTDDPAGAGDTAGTADPADSAKTNDTADEADATIPADTTDTSDKSAAETKDSGDAADKADGSGTADNAAAAGEAASDEEILKQITAEKGGEEAIAAMAMERNDHFNQQIDELGATIANPVATQEQVAEATKKQNELLDLDARLIAFEEKLLSNNYKSVVTYDDEQAHYTVNVSAPSLEKSEAVTIVKMAIKDLKITMDQISVRLVR